MPNGDDEIYVQAVVAVSAGLRGAHFFVAVSRG